MAESFVPQNTKVICTNMTVSSPQELKATRSYITIYKSKDQPLLTLVDNKMSGSFSCKNASKLWGGFQALCIGIALGAAIVLTGGLAAVVIISALALSIVAGGTAIYKAAHDCDATLQVKWKSYHPKVRIQEEYALLNKSTLTCPKGGVVNLIMDPVVASDAASQISHNNNLEVTIHMSAQFAIGAIGVATAGASGALLAAALTAGFYFPGEALGEGVDPIVINSGVILSADGATKALGGDAALFNKDIGNMIKGGYQYTKSILTKSIPEGFEGAVRIALADKALKKGKPFNGYHAVGGLLANLTIGVISDHAENALAEDTKKIEERMNAVDASNGINIISKKG